MIELESDLNLIVPVGSIFRHYKGYYYKVLMHARHSETLEMQVIYMSLYPDDTMGDYAIWARPLSIFLGTLVVDGAEMKRFTKVNRFGE